MDKLQAWLVFVMAQETVSLRRAQKMETLSVSRITDSGPGSQLWQEEDAPVPTQTTSSSSPWTLRGFEARMLASSEKYSSQAAMIISRLGHGVRKFLGCSLKGARW